MGVDVVGVNCSVGPHGVLEAVEKLARVVAIPISAQPNAGLPREVGDRKMYMASPEYMASYARRMVEAGARFVGGCCGTTPDHIRAIVGFVQSVSPRHVHTVTDPPRRRFRIRSRCRSPTARASAASWRRAASSRRSRSCRPRASIRRRCSSRRGSSRRPASTRSTCPTGPGPRAGWARCSRRS